MGRLSNHDRAKTSYVIIISITIYVFKRLLHQGYFGAAIGKAKQNAKTEIEKLKLKEMTCRQLVKEAAKM